MDLQELFLLTLQQTDCILKRKRKHNLLSDLLVKESQDELDSNWRSRKKLRKLIGNVSGATSWNNHPRKQPSQPTQKRDTRTILTLPPGDFYNTFGITADDFFNDIISKELEYNVALPRGKQRAQREVSNQLTPKTRVLLAIYFLRKGSYEDTANKFGVESSYVKRDIPHTLPKVTARLNFIMWNPHPPQHKLLGVVGAIDCSPFYRNRMSFWSGGLYRGDHGEHALTVQLVVSLTGELYDVSILLGHNNDAGAYRITEMDKFLLQYGLTLAADNGYRHSHLLCPDSKQPNNSMLLAARSVVETPFAYVRLFRIAKEKCQLKNLVMHAYALLCAFQLVALKCLKRPFRASIQPLLEPSTLTIPTSRPMTIPKGFFPLNIDDQCS